MRKERWEGEAVREERVVRAEKGGEQGDYTEKGMRGCGVEGEERERRGQVAKESEEVGGEEEAATEEEGVGAEDSGEGAEAAAEEVVGGIDVDGGGF